MLEKMIVSDYADEAAVRGAAGADGAIAGRAGRVAGVGRAGEARRASEEAGARCAGGVLPDAPRPDGLDLIDERFLKNPKAEYTHIYSTIMALRFHGDEETSDVPRERLLASMRLLLDNPDFADQVPIDLSRWERLVGARSAGGDVSRRRTRTVTFGSRW